VGTNGKCLKLRRKELRLGDGSLIRSLTVAAPWNRDPLWMA